MLKVIALTFVAAWLFAAPLFAEPQTPATEAKEPIHVYLLIGQSNMAGRAPFASQDANDIPGCYLLNDQDQWEPASGALNRHSTIRKELSMQRMGPGNSFAQAMRKRKPQVSIGLVVNARGGSSIQEWAKGGKYYNEAVRRAKKAEETGELQGILWHQGESNANDDQYLEKLQKLIGDLRVDLDNEKLPFVAGQVRQEPNMQKVNAQIAALPSKVPFTAVASSAKLSTFDKVHFDAPSAKLLGERYAAAVLSLEPKQSPRRRSR